MKPFIRYLAESKDRFIDKNRNLTDDQKEEIKKFFSTNRQAEGDVDWNRSKKMTYDDFFDVMAKYKSGRKKSSNVKRVKCPTQLKGLKKNEDYIPLKIKSREYCAYIPLNHSTAQLFNKTKVIGTCSGPWCVGHSQTSKYFRSYTKRKGWVPVYVVGNDSKWVVMLGKDNSNYSVWNVNNDHGGHEIPNFDVKKELFTSSIKNLLDQIRKDVLQKRPPTPTHIPKDEYKHAVDAYEQMAEDIEDWAESRRANEQGHWDEAQSTIDDTIEHYQELADEAAETAREEVGDSKTRRNLKDRVKSFEAILKAEPQGTGVDPKTGEPVWHIRGTEPTKKTRRTAQYRTGFLDSSASEIHRDGIPYTRKELQAFIDLYYQDYESVEFDEPDYTERDEYLDIVDRLKDINSPHDVVDDPREYEDIDWQGIGGIWEYEEYDTYPPYTGNTSYDDYFEFLDTYWEDDVDRETAYDYIWDIEWYQEVDGEDELEAMDLPHPSEVAKKYKVR